MLKFFVHIKIIFRKLYSRCPQKLRPFGGPILGGLIGLIGGIPGFFIGLLLGYLLRELFVQSFRDRKILGYFENPGLQQFYEAEPGLAAWCALAVLVASEEKTVASAARENNSKPPVPAAEKILKQVILEASCVFTGPLTEPFLMEHFSRLALSIRGRLNQDLLAESLAARRAPALRAAGTCGLREDLRNLGRALSRLAVGEKAKRLAREIRLVLDPTFVYEQEQENPGQGLPGIHDPWKILGLPPGTPLKEVKALYRRLAKQFHPDELVVLDELQRGTGARAFIAIKEAYEEVVGKY